ncbi:MAG: glycoside hydrolase family 3 protein [Ignavibacteriae bacterium]|nr:MAG: glycoside hydrolase family 3 protein [Ignavibacteriota bacterium]
MVKIYIVIIVTAVLFISCGGKKEQDTGNKIDTLNQKKDVPQKKDEQEKFTLKDFLKDNSSLDSKVNDKFNSLSPEERVSQMIVTSCGENGKPRSEVIGLIKEKKVGGVILLKGSKESLSSLIEELKKVNYETHALPLIFSCDAEPSLINNRISGISNVTHTEKINSVEQSQKTAEQVTNIIKDIGFNQNFAPVCDLGFNKEIIGDRSFGTDEKKITELANAYIKKTQELNIAATAKHFPGHGYVKGDSHKELIFIDNKLHELDIFKNVIDNGVISVMVGHIAIRNNEEFNTEGYPASLSGKVITGLLKGKLGFKGIVITDAMNMGALNKFEHPSLTAVKAGCDMILMPTDETKLLNSILNEMKTDKAFEEQVNNSVKKIIKLKYCLGLL